MGPLLRNTEKCNWWQGPDEVQVLKFTVFHTSPRFCRRRFPASRGEALQTTGFRGMTILEDRPRYTPAAAFETFPFPDSLSPDIPAADYADDPCAAATT